MIYIRGIERTAGLVATTLQNAPAFSAPRRLAVRRSQPGPDSWGVEEEEPKWVEVLMGLHLGSRMQKVDEEERGDGAGGGWTRRWQESREETCRGLDLVGLCVPG